MYSLGQFLQQMNTLHRCLAAGDKHGVNYTMKNTLYLLLDTLATISHLFKLVQVPLYQV